MLHELEGRANIECAFRAAKVVLFELIPDLGIELVEQVSFRRFFSNYRRVVHG